MARRNGPCGTIRHSGPDLGPLALRPTRGGRIDPGTNTGKTDGRKTAGHPARKTTSANAITLTVLPAPSTRASTCETDDTGETLKRALEEIEKQDQENSGMLSELADNQAVLKEEKTPLRVNLEQQAGKRLEKWEKVRESGWSADYRKRIEEGSPEERREQAAAMPTDRTNIRGGMGLIEGMEERTRKEAAQRQPAQKGKQAGGDGRQAEAEAGASPSRERSEPPGCPSGRKKAGRIVDRKERNGRDYGDDANRREHVEQVERAERPVGERSVSRLAGEKRAERPAGGGNDKDENQQGGQGKRKGGVKQGEILLGFREGANRVWRRAASGLL